MLAAVARINRLVNVGRVLDPPRRNVLLMRVLRAYRGLRLAVAMPGHLTLCEKAFVLRELEAVMV